MVEYENQFPTLRKIIIWVGGAISLLWAIGQCH